MLAVTLGHFSLVMMEKLDRRFVVVKFAALVCNALISLLALYTIWSEDFSSDLARVAGALIVLMAGLTVLVPILRRRSGPQQGKPDRTSFCPHCGAFLNLEPGDATCATCGARFRVEFRRSLQTAPVPALTVEPLKSVD